MARWQCCDLLVLSHPLPAKVTFLLGGPGPSRGWVFTNDHYLCCPALLSSLISACHMPLALKSLSKDILSAAGWICLVCATCFQLSGCKIFMSWLCASVYLSPLLISWKNLIFILIFAVFYFAVFYSNFPSSSAASGSCLSFCRGAQLPPVQSPGPRGVGGSAA